MMYVPIRSSRSVVGILSIQSYAPRAYEPQDLAMLQSLADYCGGAMERIRAEVPDSRELQELIEFIRTAKRGFVK